MAVVGEVAIAVTADVGPLIHATARAKTALQGMQGVSGRLSAGFARLGAASTRLGLGMAVVSAGMNAAGAAMFRLVSSAAAVGDEVFNSAKAAGVSAEFFQEMAFAVGQVADVSKEEFSAALTKLNQKLGEAQQGSYTAITAFEALGFSQADLAAGTVTTEMAMNAAIARFDAMKTPAEAAALAVDLFGKSSAAMGGLLRGAGGEVASLRERARELGIVMSDEAVAASEAFGDKMTELGRAFEGTKIKLATVLMPMIVDTLIPALIDKVIPAINAVIEKVGGWITAFGELPGPVQEALGLVALAIGAGGPVLLAIGEMSKAFSALLGTGPIGAFVTIASTAIIAWQLFGDDIKAAIGGALDLISEKFNAFIALIEGIPAKLKAITDDVEKFFALPAGQMTPIGAAAADGLVFGFTGRIAAMYGLIAGAIDAIPQIARDRLQIKSPSKVFIAIGEAIGAGLAGGILGSGGVVANALQAVANTAVDVGQGIADAITSAFSAGSDAIRNFVMTGKLDFSGMISSFIGDMARLAAQKYIMGPLAGALAGAFGGGVAATALHSGGMAGSGGTQRMVSAMTFSGAQRLHGGGMAGLRANEVPAILLKNERVLSPQQTRDYDRGGSMAPTVIFNVRDGESFRQSRTQIAADMARAMAMGRRGM